MMIRKAAVAAFALVLSSGAMLTGPAAATTCERGYFCTHASSYDQYRAGWRIRSLDNTHRSARYACDSNGNNCRYTKSYYIDDDGNAAALSP